MPEARRACRLTIGLMLAACGCASSQTKVATLESQNRALSEQSRAQLAEIENLKIHTRNVEDRLIRTEEELARGAQNGEHLAGGRLPPGTSGRLAELADRFPSLHYDPETGVCKIDTDVIFDSGDTELKSGAETVLHEIADIFSAPEAEDLKLMIVGHADAKGIKGRELREKYPNNWHLSAGRALNVADWLREAGLPEERMGVAGFGHVQPVSSNETADARRLNRRVEIYVLAPETPLVGWGTTQDGVFR